MTEEHWHPVILASFVRALLHAGPGIDKAPYDGEAHEARLWWAPVSMPVNKGDTVVYFETPWGQAVEWVNSPQQADPFAELPQFNA